MDVQTERAYQKQPHMFAGKCRKLSRSSRKGSRAVHSAGLGFKIPVKAKEGRYIDKKCPFTGNVSIRGKLLRGVVNRCFMKNTITVRRRLPSLHHEVPSLREASQDDLSPLRAMLRCCPWG